MKAEGQVGELERLYHDERINPRVLGGRERKEINRGKGNLCVGEREEAGIGPPMLY